MMFVADDSHWSDRYVGQPFVLGKQDCLYWFRRIAREQFGRVVPPLPVDPTRHTRSAMALMRDPATPGACGYVPTQTPKEGDAIYLGRGDDPHHLGMVLEPQGAAGGAGLWILHALEDSGVIRQPICTLARESWQIKGYYTYVGD